MIYSRVSNRPSNILTWLLSGWLYIYYVTHKGSVVTGKEMRISINDAEILNNEDENARKSLDPEMMKLSAKLNQLGNNYERILINHLINYPTKLLWNLTEEVNEVN